MAKRSRTPQETAEEIVREIERTHGSATMHPAQHDAALISRIAAAIEAERAESERWQKLEREAAEFVECVICMRSIHFTGDPPYVGWKGLGLALNQDYDELHRRLAALSDNEKSS